MDDPNLDPNLQLTGKKMGKGPLLAIAALLVGGIGFGVWYTVQQRALRRLHVEFLDRFAEFEKKDVGAFWACLLGDKIDMNQIANNLVLNQRVEGSFGADLRGYPKRVGEECVGKAQDAAKKVGGLDAPGDYTEVLKAYKKSLEDLGAAFDEWAKVAPQQVTEREIGKKLNDAGTAWHGHPGGKPPNDVIRYDRFLRCVVPSLDAMKTGQDLVQHIAGKMKDQAFLNRINTDCGKELIADPPGALDKNFAKAHAKLAADDRDVQALDDCMRRARKGKRKDDFEAVGKAWVAYIDAGKKLKTIGKEFMEKTK